jgi:hypothetical protein
VFPAATWLVLDHRTQDDAAQQDPRSQTPAARYSHMEITVADARRLHEVLADPGHVY